MTWEWLGSSVVALAGIAAGILAAYRQQQTSLAVVSQQTELQVAVAREERHHWARATAEPSHAAFLMKVAGRLSTAPDSCSRLRTGSSCGRGWQGTEMP